MSDNHRKLLTIITEAAIESQLTAELERQGARGYTITDARGKSPRGLREGDWELNANIRVEVVCTDECARRIATAIRERYYRDYAMILFIHDIEVLRPEKF